MEMGQSTDGPFDDESAVDDYLAGLTDGERLDSEQLAELVYEDLRKLARHLFRHEPKDLTIQPTALVHEAYLRLADQQPGGWENRAQFMAVAALAMRRVLTSAARERRSLKRGGALHRVTLHDDDLVGSGTKWGVLDLEAAMEALAAMRPRYARVAELRLFGGLTVHEAAQVLGVSKTVVDREWSKARAFLSLRLDSARGGDEPT